MNVALSLFLLTATLTQPIALFAQAEAPARPAGASPAIRMCRASDLSLGTDDENGAFNGMSHSGTLLVLRNLSPTACRVPQRPEIVFLDQDGKPLPVKLDVAGAKFMHPGPVLVPVVLPPDAEATAKLRWVSGNVYEYSTCVAPSALSVALGDGWQQTALAAHLCGDQTRGVMFEATTLASDPVYSGPAQRTRSR